MFVSVVVPCVVLNYLLLMVRQVSKQVLVKKRVSGTEVEAVIQIKTRHNKKKVDTTP